MRRIVAFMALVLVALLVELAMSQTIPDFSATDTGAKVVQQVNAPESKPFCQSVVVFTLPEKRWVAYVKHPGGGTPAMEESVRRLPQDGMPDPLPPGNLFDHYTVLDTACFSWPEIFEAANSLYLGRAMSLLEEPGAAITIFDQRRAVMKLFFKAHWEEAEQLFPLRAE